LRLVTYGAEPMPQSTLERLREAFPDLKLQQTYGLIEVGVMRSKSREDGSLWVKLGGEGYETRVVDGILQIKTRSTILGYLNAPTPITEDGWFVTGDAVLQDGEWFRILGRKSELINVGGEKVYPAEVESVIQSMGDVEEATVYGESNALMGHIVCAKVRTRVPVEADEFAVRVKQHCGERLERFKVPVKVQVVDEYQFGERFKKIRR
jgi:long-chain acyl-CoA synthetase